MSGGRTPAEVRDALDSVFRRAEFQDAEPTMLERLFDWLAEQFDVDLGAGGDIADVVVRILLGIFVLLLVWLVVRIALDRHQSRSARLRAERDEELARHARVRELFRSSLEARARGELGPALRQALFALVLGLGQRGSLEYRDAWTYREILRHGRPGKAAKELLSRLVEELEVKEFGGEVVAEVDVERVLELCRTHLADILNVEEVAA